jgi:hypothetical protein
MSMKFATLLAGVGVLWAISPASGHHSIQAVVDTGTVVQAEMVLTKVDWINPHAWFHFQASGAQVGKDVLIEWLSLSAMRQAGYQSADEFIVGHAFAVTYNPNRDGTVGGNLVSMVDKTTGRVFDRRGGPGDLPPRPPAPPPPKPQLRPLGVPQTNVSF